MTECRRFITNHPEILSEQDLQSKYHDPAVGAISDGDRAAAFRYLERYAIIICVKDYHEAKEGSFLSFAQNDQKAQAYMRREFTNARQHCEARAKARYWRSSDLPYRRKRFVPERDVLAAQLAGLNLDRQTSDQSVSRPAGGVTDRHGSTTTTAPKDAARQVQDPVDRHGESVSLGTPRRYTNTGHRHDPEVSDIPEEVEEDGGAAPRSTKATSGATFVDNRFQQLPLREWSYFKLGRVFAIKSYTEDLSRPNPKFDDYSVEKLGKEEMISKIRRMVVVSARDAFCLAVPINTYGGQGLNKPNLRPSNINAHARIHMEGTPPQWLRDEPRPGKKDIAVRKVKDSRHVLHPASRICFERAHSVDYNEKILKIGIVTEKCQEYLLQYWKEQIQRESGQSQIQRQHPGQKR